MGILRDSQGIFGRYSDFRISYKSTFTYHLKIIKLVLSIVKSPED